MIASLDPGSARCALVLGDVEPLRIASARVYPVDASTPDALAAMLTPILEALGTARPSRLLLERGQPYSPAAVTPQAAANIARQLILQDRLCCAVVAACGALGIAVEETPRSSWAPRLLLHAGMKASPRGDPQVRAALASILDADTMARIVGPDLADATGMLVASTLPAPQRSRSKRGTPYADLPEEAKAVIRKSARESMRRGLNRKRIERGEAPKDYDAHQDIATRVRAVLARGGEHEGSAIARELGCERTWMWRRLKAMIGAGEVTQPRRGWYAATQRKTVLDNEPGER